MKLTLPQEITSVNTINALMDAKDFLGAAEEAEDLSRRIKDRNFCALWSDADKAAFLDAQILMLLAEHEKHGYPECSIPLSF